MPFVERLGVCPAPSVGPVGLQWAAGGSKDTGGWLWPEGFSQGPEPRSADRWNGCSSVSPCLYPAFSSTQDTGVWDCWSGAGGPDVPSEPAWEQNENKHSQPTCEDYASGSQRELCSRSLCSPSQFCNLTNRWHYLLFCTLLWSPIMDPSASTRS